MDELKGAVKNYPRFLQPRVTEALADTPVVLINGPRQAGKTTLARRFVTDARPYLTLDDATALLSARQDPEGLVRSLDGAVIDEVQRAPALLLAIKKAVDENRRPGRFLLTGSADVMTLPTVADSLAGRMETLSLLPLSACEVTDHSTNWLDTLFGGHFPRPKATWARNQTGAALVHRVLSGGYPDALLRLPRRRAVWAQQYVEALLTRDVRELAAIDRLDQLPRLLKALAHVSGQLCNYSQLAGQVGVDNKTAARYLTLLERLFLLRRLAPWNVNRLGRVVKAPKIQFLDSGLLCWQSGLSAVDSASERMRFGAALECFVYAELLKQTGWAEGAYELFFFRDKDKNEVDFVVEDSHGRLLGVEVKASASVQPGDLRGLRRLAAVGGKNLVAGVVLYDGVETLPMGDGLWAMPVAALWGA